MVIVCYLPLFSLWNRVIVCLSLVFPWLLILLPSPFLEIVLNLRSWFWFRRHTSTSSLGTFSWPLKWVPSLGLTITLQWQWVIFSVTISAGCSSSDGHLNVYDRYIGHGMCPELFNHHTRSWVLSSFPAPGQLSALPPAKAPSHSFVCGSSGSFGLFSF